MVVVGTQAVHDGRVGIVGLFYQDDVDNLCHVAHVHHAVAVEVVLTIGRSVGLTVVFLLPKDDIDELRYAAYVHFAVAVEVETALCTGRQSAGCKHTKD